MGNENINAGIVDDNQQAAVLSEYSAELQEIILRKRKDSIFCEYKPSDEIGDFIYNELKDKRTKIKKDKGMVYKDFYLSADQKESGVLSQTQALQTLLTLLDTFKHELTDEIRDIVIDTLDSIIASVYKKNSTTGEVKMVFDATPYSTSFFEDNNYYYIDSITWVITTLLSVLKVSVDEKIGQKLGIGEERTERIYQIITFGLKEINNAYIPKKQGDVSRWHNGWNFTGKCENPSLYFSYAVSECYVDIYEYFEDVIRVSANNKKIAELKLIQQYSQTKDWKATLKNEISKLEEENDEANRKKIEEFKAVLSYDYSEGKIATLNDDISALEQENDEASKKTAYEPLRKVFIKINNGLDVYDSGSLYNTLELNCKELAAEVWKYSQKYLADNFLNNDLVSVIDEDVIKKSTTSDGLFNSLYIINILIDGGLDEEYDLRIKEAAKNNKTEEKEIAQRDYDNLFQVIKLAFEKTKRTYENLKLEKKEYIVDQFVVGFNEAFGTHADAVKELRKLRIRIFAILPLFAKTNSMISEYLVKYPQSEMISYLETILKNRSRNKNDQYVWCWDRDGYSTSSNYYYVSALENFYSYYEQYEEKFSKIEDNNQAVIDKIKNDYLDELKDVGIISNLTKDKDELSKKVEALTKERDELKTRTSEVENSINKLVDVRVREIMVECMSEAFAKMAKEATEEIVNNTPLSNATDACNNNLMQFLLTLISQYAKRLISDGDSAKFEEYRRLIGTDLKEVLRLYVLQVTTKKGMRSDFVKTNGYEGIISLLLRDNK